MTPPPPETTLSPADAFAASVKRSPKTVSVVKGIFLALYALLLFLPLIPGLSHLKEMSQLILWGAGWPLIAASVMFFSRFFCGVACPDGTLTEWASAHGKHGSIPAWIRSPVIGTGAFLAVILSAQCTDAFRNHTATLLVLGIPTTAALIIGYLYGNAKRIYCLYACPVNFLFGIFAKNSYFAFKTDLSRWDKRGYSEKINCAPLVNIRRMESASACHACFRCHGYCSAVSFSSRSPVAEFRHDAPWSAAQTFFFLWALAGVASAALFRHFPLASVFFSPLEAKIGSAGFFSPAPAVFALVFGSVLALALAALFKTASSAAGLTFTAVAQCLVPLVSFSVLSGLFHTAASLWGFGPSSPVTVIRSAMLVYGTVLSLAAWLKTSRVTPGIKRAAGTFVFAAALALSGSFWIAA